MMSDPKSRSRNRGKEKAADTDLRVGTGAPLTGASKMFSTKDTCPLCKSDAERIALDETDVQYYRNCPRCKEYKISNAFLARIQGWRTGAADPHLSDDLLKRLSIAARRAIERGEAPICI